MRVLRQIGVLVLLLVSCLAPAMACMIPNAEMSAQERVCCRMMKNQCGQMDARVSWLLPEDPAKRSQGRAQYKDSVVSLGCYFRYLSGCVRGKSFLCRHRLG
jgi:hypothetical protein